MTKSLPRSVNYIIEALNKTEVIDNNILPEIIESAGLKEEDLLPFNSFLHPESESYGRYQIYGNDRYKILLMSWRPGDFTAIHDHGLVEWGCVCFFGKTTHRTYAFQDGQLRLSKCDVFEAGQISLLKGELTHMMGNGSSANIITLHIYGADSGVAFKEGLAKVYAPEEKKLFYTSGEAYLDICHRFVKHEEDFFAFDKETVFDYIRLTKSFFLKRRRLIQI
ncbi:MAG: cysteine dioxygenase family protein [Bacteroidales bacterium]|nr:cysteine dioxygenase family protein [Bacteroidales bacterium]